MYILSKIIENIKIFSNDFFHFLQLKKNLCILQGHRNDFVWHSSLFGVTARNVSYCHSICTQRCLKFHNNYGNILAVSGVGSSPALATCETSQVLLAGVSGGFSRGSPVFAPPTDWLVSCELK